VAEPTLDTMTEDGVADAPPYHEPDPDRSGPIVDLSAQQVHHERVAAGAASGAGHEAEVTTARETVNRR
jgi:hypothetical protein